MTFFLTANAMLTCSFGSAPCVLVVPPLPGRPLVGGNAVAAITDTAPMNIATFAMCSSLANPTVVSATAAAQGVLTPMPCMPVIASPWVPPSLPTQVGGLPAALAASKCLCSFGGMIAAEVEPNFIASG